MKILSEILKVVVLEIPLLIMSYVLFWFAFSCASDPQLFNITQSNACTIINPLAMAVIFASPIFAILTYFFLRIINKNYWKQVWFSALIIIALSLILYWLKNLVF